jgi:hypothetical protein
MPGVSATLTMATTNVIAADDHEGDEKMLPLDQMTDGTGHNRVRDSAVWHGGARAGVTGFAEMKGASIVVPVMTSASIVGPRMPSPERGSSHVARLHRSGTKRQWLDCWFCESKVRYGTRSTMKRTSDSGLWSVGSRHSPQ